MEPSSRSSGAIKTFSLEEANDLLPHVTKMMDSVMFLNGRIKSLTIDIESLVSIWGKDVLDKDHTDNEFYFGKVSEREGTFKELVRKISEIQSIGCVVKDAENGLVDFYHDRNGDLIFLCWKYGEDRINFWHEVSEGFKNRQPVNRL